MKTSKHWAINSSFHTISCVLAKPKLVRAIYNLVYTSPWDMNGLGKTKTKWRGRERIGAIFFFLFLAFRGGHAVKRRGKQNTIYNKVQESNHWPNYFCISVWQIEFWTGMSSPSSHPAMSCTYTHLSCCFLVVLLSFCFVLLFFLNKIRSASGGIHKRHLVEGSDRRYVDEMIWFLPSYLNFLHERDRNCLVSGLVLRELQRKQFKQL